MSPWPRDDKDDTDDDTQEIQWPDIPDPWKPPGKDPRK